MPYLNCPKQETLLEYLSIPQQMSLWMKLYITSHRRLCGPCEEKLRLIEATMDSYFTPAPDIASSLIRVYSQLQHDETLVLKGWKLGEFRSRRDVWLSEGWLFRGAVSIGLGVLLVIIFISRFTSEKNEIKMADQGKAPYARLRFEDQNKVTVQYVQPELLHTVEFETSR